MCLEALQAEYIITETPTETPPPGHNSPETHLPKKMQSPLERNSDNAREDQETRSTQKRSMADVKQEDGEDETTITADSKLTKKKRTSAEDNENNEQCSQVD